MIRNGLDRVILLACCLVLLAACTAHSSTPPSQPTVTGPVVPNGVRIEVAPAGVAPKIPNTTALSKTYDLTPSGPLTESVKITLPLTSMPSDETGVLVATAESAQGPWTLLAANVSQDRRSVSFTTDHFSFFATIGADLKQMFAEFKQEFVDPLTSSVTAEATAPRCSNEAQARSDGYGISSSHGSTVYWCLGLSGGARRLTVVNNRRYPLEISYRGLPVVSKPSFFSGALGKHRAR